MKINTNSFSKLETAVQIFYKEINKDIPKLDEFIDKFK